MLRTLDRYVVRETLVPFFLALLVFTFILQIPPVMEVAEKLIAKGVDAGTIAGSWSPSSRRPSASPSRWRSSSACSSALGRLSGDREIVAARPAASA